MVVLELAAVGLTREDASSIAGWISIACWIIVYSPQIWENYQLKSGEGLSVAFIVLWLAGDVANLVGGIGAGLLKTMIILAVYYTLCDIILLIQVYYYRRRTARLTAEHEETCRLLSETHESEHPETTVLIEHGHPKSVIPSFLLYPFLFSFVAAVGVVAWVIQTRYGDGHVPIHGPKARVPDSKVELEWKSQFLGYLSAVLYIGSRLPQISHNDKTRCAGLSLDMFAFSISGNLTYVASILLKSTKRDYVIANASWLAGSGLTVFLDLIVLGQFAYFRYQDNQIDKVKAVFEDEAP